VFGLPGLFRLPPKAEKTLIRPEPHLACKVSISTGRPQPPAPQHLWAPCPEAPFAGLLLSDTACGRNDGLDINLACAVAYAQ
jgi:hypothetical protein